MRNPWDSIKKPERLFNLKLVAENHPLKLYWGVDTSDKYLFVYDSPAANLPDKKNLPSLAGIDLSTLNQGNGGKLLLLLQDKSDWELFYTLCTDLVRATATQKDETSAPAIIVGRLKRWQEFLRKNRPRILNIEQIKGLIGELLFMRDQLASRFGWEAAVSFWKGPEDAPQDFAVDKTAVEVKCQSGGSKPTVRISSADQLTPQLPKGYLAVYTLAGSSEDGDGVFSLNSLVDAIRAALEPEAENAREKFDDLIFMAGYLYNEKYDEHRFSIVGLKSFRLRDGFPRITSDDVRQGIERVSYAIRLETCEPFAEKPDWWTGE